VSAAVAEAASRADQATDGLVQVARDTAAGAREGLERRAAADRNQALREVLDGLTDGLGRTAHSAQLALEEAAGRGKAFAEEDLARVRRDFDGLREGFGQALRQGLGALRSEAAEAAQHAERTFAGLRPQLDRVLAAAKQDPAGLARGAVEAGAHATRQGAGAFFESLGRLLKGRREP
jgi:type VI protein secretion system component VasK